MIDAIEQVRQLSDWLQGTDITLLELSGPGKLIRLRRDGPLPSARAMPMNAAATSHAATERTLVRAGSVGIVLHAHPLRAEPLVRLGQQVQRGQTLALLRIGLVLLAVPAPRAGTVFRVVAAHETPVGYGDPLIELA
jgi:acetyl-CoA carboxylase biotin carboxyl carrier protein